MGRYDAGPIKTYDMSKSNVASAIQNLKMADEFINDFIREFPGSKGAKLFRVYSQKINWIFRDMLSHPDFSDTVREGIRNELHGDVFNVPALFEKIPLLNPEQRDAMESIVDLLLAGETLEILQHEQNS